jgi:hypothetical protein
VGETNMNISKDAIIKQYVSQIEKGNLTGVYKDCIVEIAKIPFKDFDEKNAGNVLEDYLYVWGKMGRVVGQNLFWQRDLTRIIRSKAKALENLRGKRLENEQLKAHKTEIKEYYDSFQKIIWQVAAAKVLHLLCPDFFPLWDDDIAKAYRRVVGKDEHIEKFSPDDYFRFMEWVQEFIMKHSKVLSELAATYGKTKVRILDECLLYAVRNPYSLIL